MGWSSIVHALTSITGLASIAAMICMWIFGENGLWIFSKQDLYNTSIILILIAIWFALGVLIHLVKEDKEE